MTKFWKDTQFGYFAIEIQVTSRILQGPPGVIKVSRALIKLDNILKDKHKTQVES